MNLIRSFGWLNVFIALNCLGLSCDQISLLYVKIGCRAVSKIFNVIFVVM